MKSRSARCSAMVRSASGRNWFQGWMWTCASTTIGRFLRALRGAVRGQDDLAERRALQQRAVRVGDLLERQHAVDDRPQAALADEPGDTQQLGAASHGRPENRQSLEEDE